MNDSQCMKLQSYMLTSAADALIQFFHFRLTTCKLLQLLQKHKHCHLQELVTVNTMDTISFSSVMKYQVETQKLSLHAAVNQCG